MRLTIIENSVSTIPVQLYPKMEVKIEWGDIFRRLVVEKRGGLCYERNEVLYQALIIMGFKVHRMECQYTDRFDHMGLVIHLDGKWYFCDGGYVCEFRSFLTIQTAQKKFDVIG